LEIKKRCGCMLGAREEVEEGKGERREERGRA
jgi:hypothetical protein